MIKGRGHRHQFIGYDADLEYIYYRHSCPSADKDKLSKIHLDFESTFESCPKEADNGYHALPDYYTEIRNILDERYFDSMTAIFCCYCGRAEPDELDHFYPKKKVPQLSIARFNLIKCCGPCNNSKHQKFPVSELGLKNPYLDPIYSSVEILFVVSFVGVIRSLENQDPIFHIEISPNPKLAPDVQESVEKGLTEMKIRSKVKEKVSLEMARISRKRGNFPWDSNEVSKKFSELAKESYDDGKIIEYFSYFLLSKHRTIRSLNSAMS